MFSMYVLDLKSPNAFVSTFRTTLQHFFFMFYLLILVVIQVRVFEQQVSQQFLKVITKDSLLEVKQLNTCSCITAVSH